MPSGDDTVLALDLEGTLVSNAVSVIARPGLCEFLAWCATAFSRVVVFTTVPEARFRAIAQLLVEERAAPAWFAGVEYVGPQGPTKDLRRIPGARLEHVVLVDDHASYVHPGQEHQWVPVESFAYEQPDADTGLARLREALCARLRDVR